jgi:hypothetical protein
MGKMISTYKVLVGKPQGKGPLIRCGCKFKGYMQINFGELRYESMDWI